MEITGKIIAVLQPQGGVSARTGNSWKSQDYVIETQEQYPKKCVFRVFGEDKIGQFNIQAGEVVTVSFDIDAHEYNGRWYNDVRAWAVNHNPQVAPAAAPNMAPNMAAATNIQQPTATPFPPADQTPSEGSADDLPF